MKPVNINFDYLVNKSTSTNKNVPKDEVVTELSWVKPYNRLGTWAQGVRAGRRGGMIGDVISRINPVSDQDWGQSELKDETNEIWDQF